MGDPFQAARDLGPSLAKRAQRIENNRSLPQDVVDDLTSAGLFRLFTPASLGGPEVDVATGLNIISEVARYDGGTAWCVMIAATTSLLAGYLDEPFAQEIYGPADSCTGGFAAPFGKAKIVDGGLQVSGTWAWGSGTQHCTWVGGGALLVDQTDTPIKRADGLYAPFVFFKRSDVQHLDTWRVTGLSGSGSTDYPVSDVFGPEGRWVQLRTATPRRDGPQGRFPF